MENDNFESVNKLLKDLYSLTSMKVNVYDENYNEIAYYPAKYEPFCASLRKNPELDLRCKECDKKAFEVVKKTKKPYLYFCHAGLLESLSPILYNDEIVGYIATGQVRTDESSIKCPFPDLSKEFENTSFVTKEKAQSIINIIQACAGFEYLKSTILMSNKKIEKSIELFIDSRISKQISVEDICEQFHLSRNEVYRIFRIYFKSTPANFIKSKRISKACELLKESHNSIKEIAVLVGISDYNYFSKVFKKEKHLSPLKYKRLPN